MIFRVFSWLYVVMGIFGKTMLGVNEMCYYKERF